MIQLTYNRIFSLDSCAGPYSLVIGKDKNLWITETKANKIARLTPYFELREFELPTHNCGAMLLGAADEGIYYTEYHADRLSFISYDGHIKERQLEGKCSPFGIAVDDENTVWFTCMVSNQIGKLSNNKITYFDIPTPASFPSFITYGADGALWFTENQGNKIGRITKQGDVTEYELPVVGSGPVGISAGMDAVWFAEIMGGRIGKMAYSGELMEYTLPTTDAKPHAVAISQNGLVAFTEWAANRIGVITVDGKIKEFDIPMTSAEPHGLLFDERGFLWVALEAGAVGVASFEGA